MPKLYRIRNWDKHFETCETRKLKHLDWWPKPNKHDGLGFRRLVAERDNISLYCAWNLICDIASRSATEKERGILIRDGAPLTAKDLAIMTGFPEPMFQKALEFFSSTQQQWLTCDESHETPYPKTGETCKSKEATQGQAVTNGNQSVSAVVPGELPGMPGESPAEGKGREGNGREVSHSAKAESVALPESDQNATTDANSETQWLAGLKSDIAYRGIDVEREHAKMRRWCSEHKRHATRKRFIAWLNRADIPLSDTQPSKRKGPNI